MPLLHLAHLLLCRGRHRRRHATPSALHSRESTAGAAVVELTLPSGGSNGPQSTEEVPFRSNFLNVVTTSTATLRPAFAEALARLEPQLDLLVHDGFLVSAKDTAADLDVSQLVSVGTSGFASYVCATVMRQKPHVHVSRWAAGGRRVSELAWRKQASVVVIVSGGGRGRGRLRKILATPLLPAPRNSHPQSSGAADEFLVVHNGIITNYEVLKETLTHHGFTFESDTDTEVIPKLAKFVFDKAHDEKGDVTFSQVVMEVMRQLEGAYALIFKSPHYPNELIACKRGSTLILGVNELSGQNSGKPFHDVKALTTNGKPKELFFSSDLCAIVEHTKNYLAIEDNEIVHIKDGSVSVLKFDQDRKKPASVQRALSVLEMEVEQIKKGSYDHFMQKEIHEQPHSLTTTMRGRLKDGGILLGGLKEHLKTIRRSRRVVFIGCGTSYNAALAARPFVEELTGIPVTMEVASDLLDRQGPIYREDTAVFVSQSGETVDTLLALDYGLENGALCVGITNTVGSTLSRRTHCGVHINVGCEIGVASTKAYTSQIVAMAMMALAIGSDQISTQARRDAITSGLSSLPSNVSEVLNLDVEMKELASSLIDSESLIVFGRGYNYATALESALKVKDDAQ